MPILLVFAIVMQAHAARQPVDVRRLTISTPVPIVRMAADFIRGEPLRLAWSPDARHLYLRTVKSDRWGNQTIFHYQIAVGTGELGPIEHEPEWFGRYWMWKSAQSSPGSADFRITYESREERKTAVGVVSAGAIAQSGGDPSLGSELGPQGQAFASAAMQGQMVRTTTLRLKGQLLGEFVNMLAIPGLTFGWAPDGMDAIAYVGKKGRVIIMDRAGRRREVPGIQDAVLPAWSQDGRRLAWLQRQGKKEFMLAVTEVDEK